ncbi:MAG: hypothetical protein KBD76_05995 [Bacteriovorax sp.]|jgi:hypothetical protein|nr:hypothetical protein [Bacteriovorax sp.]
MRLHFILFTLIIQLFHVNALAGDCTTYLGSCEYYLCREKEHACGKKGYYRGFAYKYCKKSQEKLAPKLSAKGRRWSRRVMLCLEQSVEKIPYDDNCKDVKITAIKEHDECYIDNNFCSLSWGDKIKILSLIYPEARHPQILKEGMLVFKNCL